jgi:hypothetical protein
LIQRLQAYGAYASLGAIEQVGFIGSRHPS